MSKNLSRSVISDILPSELNQFAAITKSATVWFMKKIALFP
jgi:hypothetical protein